MNKRELEQAISDEVAEWPGVAVEFVPPSGKGHPKAKFTFGDLIMSRPYSNTPSDGAFGLHRCLGDMRRVMKQMGAARAKAEPTAADLEKRYAKPNDGAEKRPDPIASDRVKPKPDLADQLVAAGVAEKAKAEPLIVWKDDAQAAEPEQESDQDAERAEALAVLKARVAAIEDGVYFDLDDQIYHAVEALGSGSISSLLVSPATFWRGSWLDPERPELDEEATLAQILGKAYHTARLEPEKLHERFCPELDKSAFPKRGMVTTGPEIEAALEQLGEKKKLAGEKVADQAQRLYDAGYQGTIWHVEQKRWAEQRNGRQPIKAKHWREIEIDMMRLQGIPSIANLLQGGAAEVSVFWTDRSGIRCKARLDYLRPDGWVDFKTFENSRRKILNQAIADAFRYNYYYLQAVHYRDSVEAIRVGGLPVRGDATDQQRGLIAQIQLSDSDLICHYVMQEKGGVPNILAREFEFFNIPLNVRAQHAGASREGIAAVEQATRKRTSIHQKAAIEIDYAKRQFALYSQVCQPGEPWAPIEPMGTIGDDDFNTFWLENS